MAAVRRTIASIDRSTATLWLAAGDVALIAAFVVLGEIRHYPLDLALARTPGTLIPFLSGWAVAAILLGLYTVETRTDIRRTAGRTVVAWLVATALAMALRATPVFHGNADGTFALVAVLVGLVLLLPWRVGATYLGSA